MSDYYRITDKNNKQLSAYIMVNEAYNTATILFKDDETGENRIHAGTMNIADGTLVVTDTTTHIDASVDIGLMDKSTEIAFLLAMDVL